MYIIKRFGRRFGSKTFDSYDAARNYLRKFIRSGRFDYTGSFRDWYNDHSDSFYRNPATSRYGFKIVAV